MVGARQPLSEIEQGDRDPRSRALCRGRSRADDDELAILDESKETLAGRVARLDTGMAWAEDPPSRTRHFIANIEVEAGDTDGEITVYSNFIVYRSRAETEQDFYVGARRDVLRRVEGAWKIAHAASWSSTRTCCGQERQHLFLDHMSA